MNKSTYYLWKQDYPTQKEFEGAKELYRELGFRVVTYEEAQNEQDIHEGLKAFLKSYIM